MTDDMRLFRHLWNEYSRTMDGRANAGDVNILAEAVERIDWRGTPEIGAEIARLLRLAYVGDKDGLASKHYRVVRNGEIVGLAKIHATQKLTQKDSFERIADVYGMTVDAVRKVVERERMDK